jgi:predicted ATPase/transcriptional regulator with XRE-family HTH domain
VAEQAAPGFSGLLRQLRADAGLTQEELAEAARLSPRTVSDLERGISRTARKDTALLLADALGLAGRVRGVFVAAAQGRVLATEVLAARAQAPRASAGNLPVPLSSFVGRVGELAELAAAMARSPLVTVTGVGGVGKTRLALHAAAGQLPSFRDGVWLCELHPAVDEETMAQAVAAALRVRPRPGLSVAGSIVEFLRTKNALVVLDNCEHLPGAPAVLAAGILRSCRGVRLLATSRQALSVEGEQVFGLRPLPLPPSDAGVVAAAASDAVCLFVERAAAARRDFVLTAANVAAVGQVCRRLDGIPLAIELAAARVAALRPAEIAGLLDERFRLLTGGRADAAARQQTLQATVEWSYALLGQAERRVFDCLGVFPGSFDAAAAADIAAADGLQRWDILDSLTSLVGKSLVAEEDGPGQTSRYRLLETMRAYARQHLAAGELGRLQHRHAEHYAAFAERAGPEVVGPAQLEWQQRIRAERDNLQAAVTWALTSGGQPRPLAFRIVAALAAFATTSPGTVRGWAEACAAQIGACPPELRAPVIAAAAWSALYAGDVSLAQRRAEDALRDPAAGDPLSLGLLRAVLSLICMLTGQPERGASIAREGRHQAAEHGIEILVGELLAMEARTWTTAGDRAAARRPAMEAVEAARRVQNPGLSALAFYAAAAAIWPGDPQTALMLIEDSLALTRAGASDIILDAALIMAGVIRARTGDLPRALAALQEAMARQHADGNRLLLGITLEVAAVVLARLGEAKPSAVLSGAFSAHFTPGISAVPKDERMEIGEARSLARHALGEAAYSAALAQGAAMDDDEVVGYAQGEYRRLASLGAEPSAPAAESPLWPGAADPPGMTVLPGNVPQHSWRGQVPQSFQPARGRRPPGPAARQAGVALAAANAAGQHRRTGVLPKLPALPAAYDRHAEPRTPERADLREASRMDGAGISRAESAWTRRLASWPSRSRSATSWPAYGSNSWLPRHKLASPLIFDP